MLSANLLSRDGRCLDPPDPVPPGMDGRGVPLQSPPSPSSGQGVRRSPVSPQCGLSPGRGSGIPRGPSPMRSSGAMDPMGAISPVSGVRACRSLVARRLEHFIECLRRVYRRRGRILRVAMPRGVPYYTYGICEEGCGGGPDASGTHFDVLLPPFIRYAGLPNPLAERFRCAHRLCDPFM